MEFLAAVILVTILCAGASEAIENMRAVRAANRQALKNVDQRRSNR